MISQVDLKLDLWFFNYFLIIQPKATLEVKLAKKKQKIHFQPALTEHIL